MRVAILGATRGMGRQVARRLAERRDSLVLLGRNEDALQAMCTDLSIRGARHVHAVPCDLSDESTFGPALSAASEFLHGLDAIVVTAGLFGTQDQLEDDLALTHRVLDVDFTKTILFCEHARRLLLDGGGGTLVVFSSVAGDRGRKTVGLYGAAKAGLSHYLESLDHRYRARGLVTITVKPGFIRTGMTDGLKEPPFAGEPDVVAEQVVRAMDHQVPVLYTPRPWWYVMAVVRALPRFVMRRVGF